MGNEATVAYQISVTKTGDGASAAVAEFKAVAAAANEAAGKINNTTPAVNNANTSTVAATKSFGAFKGALTLVAGQAFPQLTGSIMVAKNAVDSMRASNTQLTANFATTAAAVAGLAGLIMSAASAWQVYAAEKLQAQSSSALSEQESAIQKSLVEQIDLLKERQELTNEEARRLKEATGTSSGNRGVTQFLRGRQEGNAQDRLSELRLTQEYQNADERAKNPVAFNRRGAVEERSLRQNIEMEKEINQLRQEGLLTQQDADRLLAQNDIELFNRHAELKMQLTEIQQLQRSAAEQFAGGFASAFTDFVSGTKSAKEAFADFARSFISSIIQMIVQLLVLKAIKSVFGGALGLAQGGVALAAQGGVFPQFAANGLAGVNSVSSATYFPKFNVVAGEAGREMMTVLARPRMMEVGGMQAVVGSAQGNQLAITNAGDLANAGTGGTIVIQVQGTRDFEARVVQNSVKGAVVQVANEMRQDSAISRGVKGLTA